MPRKPREKSKTGIYHVVVRGIGQQDIFHEDDDFQRYLDTARKISPESGVRVLGYCLMNNHVHLLLREESGDISLFMKCLGVSYAYWYNWKYDRTGHVFQDRFKSECVEDDVYLVAVIRYIHRNPVKARIVSIPEEYRWSSCAAYCQMERDDGLFPDTRLILDTVHKNKMTAVKMLKKFTETDNEDCCLDCDERKRISEKEALEIARNVLKGEPARALQMAVKEERDRMLNILKDNGLSIRQICRITGLPLHVVRRA